MLKISQDHLIQMKQENMLEEENGLDMQKRRKLNQRNKFDYIYFLI